jgi:transcriptional regulator with XRE-family HTH domain
VSEEEDRTSLSSKISFLFSTVLGPNGELFTPRTLAAHIQERYEVKISHTYLWQLRTGERDNPTKQHIEVLSSAFGVTPAYFFADDEAYLGRVRNQVRALQAMKTTKVDALQARVIELNDAEPEVRDRIAQLINLALDLHRDGGRDEAE